MKYAGANLIETILAAVTDIDYFDDFSTQTGVEKITLAEFCLEICATSEDKASDVDLVIGDEVLYGVFCDFPDVVVSLLVTKSRETQGRLTSTAVLLR